MEERSLLFQLNFEISSDLNLISDVVTEIVKHSSGILDDLYMFEVAVHEAIYNAIEHGNLEITRARKERMIEEGTYDDFLKKVASEKKCNSKKVIIETKIYDKSMEITIEDEGRGFNWKEEMENAKISTGNELDQFNGYGLKIILSVFENVFYNEKGNKLTLVKFKKDGRKI